MAPTIQKSRFAGCKIRKKEDPKVTLKRKLQKLSSIGAINSLTTKCSVINLKMNSVK